jgi:hypothetical protein
MQSTQLNTLDFNPLLDSKLSNHAPKTTGRSINTQKAAANPFLPTQ